MHRLHEAIETSDVEMVKYLIEQGDDVNAKGDDKTTPLETSICESIEITKILLDAKADVNLTYSKRNTTILSNAIICGHDDLVKLLISYKADVNKQSRSLNGKTALHVAIDLCRNDIVEELIRVRANVNIRDDQGYTPIMLSLFSRSPVLNIEMLLNVNASTKGIIRIPKYLKPIFEKLKNVKQSLVVFCGVLRKRYKVKNESTALINNNIPHDIVYILSLYAWESRRYIQWDVNEYGTHCLKRSRC